MTVRFPYRMASDSSGAESWQLVEGARRIPLPERHPAWDASVDVRVGRRLVVDGRQLLERTGLRDGSRVRLVAGYDCETARTRDFPFTQDLTLPSHFEGDVEFTVPASELARSVSFVVGAILVDAKKPHPPFSARVPGSWLWREETPFQLEAEGERFPMEQIDFRASGLPPEAAWYLEWDSDDWDRPIHGAMRLQFNATNDACARLLELPEDDPRHRLFLATARLDVAKQLVIAALSSDDFVSRHHEFEEGSLGRNVRGLISLAFPGSSVDAVRTLMKQAPGKFHARLQANLGRLELEVES